MNKVIVTSRDTSFWLSSNNSPPSPPYRVGIKRKVAPEGKSNDEFPEGIGDYALYYPLVIDEYLKMCDMTLRWIYFGKIYWKQWLWEWM